MGATLPEGIQTMCKNSNESELKQQEATWNAHRPVLLQQPFTYFEAPSMVRLFIYE